MYIVETQYLILINSLSKRNESDLQIVVGKPKYFIPWVRLDHRVLPLGPYVTVANDLQDVTGNAGVYFFFFVTPWHFFNIGTTDIWGGPSPAL